MCTSHPGAPWRRFDLKWTLVQRSPTVLGPTQTGDLLVLDGELVVVGDLLVDVNGLPGVDHNLLLSLHCDDLRITVGLKEKQNEGESLERVWLLSFCFCAEAFTKKKKGTPCADVVLHCSCG